MRQGEAIQFYAKIEPKHAGDVTDWSAFSSITMYAYTNESHIVKFKYPSSSGYEKLTISSDKVTCEGVIPAADTKKMLGPLYIEVLVDLNGENKIEKRVTGLQILPDTIKQEV